MYVFVYVYVCVRRCRRINVCMRVCCVKHMYICVHACMCACVFVRNVFMYCQSIIINIIAYVRLSYFVVDKINSIVYEASLKIPSLLFILETNTIAKDILSNYHDR